MRRIRLTLKFLLLVIWSAIRQRTVELPHVAGTEAPSARLTPQGRYMPAIAGAEEGDPEPDPDPDPDPADPDPTPEPDPDPVDPEPDPDPDPEPWDQKRAERTIKQQREQEKREREGRQKAEKERDELRKAQETEQETVKRERDEALAVAERERSARQHSLIDLAIRDAAAEADVPAKKVRRLLKLVDREGITVNEENEVTGAEDAVTDFLDEFPEFGPSADLEPNPDPDPDDDPGEPGGKPDRKRKPKELTAKQVQEMAKSDPEKFNRLFDEEKIPKSALEGLKP